MVLSPDAKPVDLRACGRPLPCLFHTPYEPEFPADVWSDRRATHNEVLAGRTCAECLRAVEVHDQGKPTKGLYCQLRGQYVNPRQTCDHFLKGGLRA
jgi:hypothetical protein